MLGDGLLERGIGHLNGIKLGGVARQVEDLDKFGVPGEPSLDRLAVVYPEVVQDQEHLAPIILHQPAQEGDQDA